MKIAVTGAAGLVGQNLIARAKLRGNVEIVAFDKHPANTAILRRLHPDIRVVEADLAVPGQWAEALTGVQSVILGHAQIGGLVENEFTRNNITATQNLLAALRAQNVDCRLIHISSSVVNSAAFDWYTQTKKAQESIVLASGYPVVVLRPTLMFGWFDRKHLGWLARFMKHSPAFPVPGNGRYLRQPLYVGDFCDIIMSCLASGLATATFNISGQEKIDYIDLVRLVREATGATTPIVRIPFTLFRALLAGYGMFDHSPPFTTRQLAALVIPETFEVIDWPRMFNVRSTPLRAAMMETFRDPTYSTIVLEF
ncbi:MAG TPA: NAD-dependent epimerase/dehydratase family protein [Steroidobacteraceae bacterium]|jgi:nucleoside-diphosphate-sugar epimerase|nr:NAD-dependent epimerase/dehydratase family protein [Steroidobacteraceae bacterium]